MVTFSRIGRDLDINIPQADYLAGMTIYDTDLLLHKLLSLGFLEELSEFINQMNFYNIFPSQIFEPQQPIGKVILREDGANTAETLFYLQTHHRDIFSELVQSLKIFLPDIESVSVENWRNYLMVWLKHTAGTNQNLEFDLKAESDGTARILALLTALYQQPPRAFLAFEEPELMIYPNMLAVLWDIFELVLDQTQIILTTHSPDLVDLCSAEQIRVVEKVNGLTQVGPISALQKAAIQQRLLSPGQLFRAQGLHRAEQNGAQSE